MVSKILIRSELEQLLKTNDTSITFKKVQQTDNTSSFWPHFSLIFVEDVIQYFVLCDRCRTVVYFILINITDNT